MPAYTKPKLLPNSPARRSPRAIEDLAILPVFFKLEGRKAVLAGGSDAAAWKADLLAASGAIVHVYAETFDDEFEELLVGPRSKSFVVHRRVWAQDCFEGASIAIADAASDGEAQAFYCSAKAAGVPVNVIDRPAYCEFQFGSIVNRSPAIVSISTNGAAPILGQAIRRRVETLLPSSLKEWALFAQSIRETVTAKLNAGLERRKFWERFSSAAFTRPFSEKECESTLAEIEEVGHQGAKGSVTLVGAGPGDAELLTLKAMRALQSADVILFDDLVSDEVLELSRREAKKMLVGKRGGRESCNQEDINALLVQFAKAGKNVVRLKSGDPVLFGRAGEEIAMLEAADIPVSIVPGITSASAMAAMLGVSLTHRDHAQSVRFVTGHSRKGKLPTSVDWAGIAREATSTVFYMGGRTASQIRKTLLEHEMSETAPVVIASAVSRTNVQTWHGTVQTMNTGIEVIGLEEPVLIGVGEVFRERRAVEMLSHSQTSAAGLC